jgi:prepilin-type N-terminal cleavage/methylation domain-containing protein
MSPRRTRAGFTLIELMVALVAGLIAISAIYTVSGASARHFHEQQRIAATQMSLRMAMTQLRADLARAGLYGTPNSDSANPPNLQGCPKPSPRIQAVEFRDDPDGAAFADAYGNNGIQFDRLRLTGNYSTTGGYMVASAATATELRLQTDWQGFRRDFMTAPSGGDGTAAVVDEAAFGAAFKAGRYVHVRTLQETSAFARIASVFVGGTSIVPDVRVQLQDPLAIASPCLPGLGDGAVVAPLSRIEYAVVDPRKDDALAALRSSMDETTENQLGLRPAVLVRREIPFGCTTDCAPIAGTTRVVLEFAADFELRFVVDNQPDPSRPPDLQVLDGAAAQNALDPENSGNYPEQVRSVIVRLSARTPGTDPRFAFVEPDDGPLTRFQAHPDAPGASRVRTIEAEIFLPNLVPAPAF